MKRTIRLSALSAAILVMAALATASCTDAVAPLADVPSTGVSTDDEEEDLTGKPIQIGSVVSLAPNDGAETRAISTDPDFPVEGSTMTVFCFVPTDAMDDKACSPAAHANYIYDGTSASWKPTNPDAPLCWQSGTLNHFFAAVSPAVDDTEVDFGAGAKAFISTATFYVVYGMVFDPAFSLPVTWTNELYTAWGSVRSTGIGSDCGCYEPKADAQISLTLCRPLVSIDIISESTKVMLRNAPSATNGTGTASSKFVLRTMQMLPSDGGLIHRAYTLPYPYSDTGKTNISFTTDAGASISTVEKEKLIAGSKVMINGQDNTSAVTNSTAGGLGDVLNTADPNKKKIVIGGTINDEDMNALSTFIKSNSITDVAILADGVTSIGDDAFNSCTSLTSINLPDGVTSIGNNAFNECYNLTSINLPNELTSIGNSAFSQCYNLTSISLPDGMTSIGMATFANCDGLTSINLPKGVTSIEDGAFCGCTSLISISLPDGVTRIGDWAFESCRNLKEISLSGINDQFELALPTLGGKAFTSTKLTTLYLRDVPPDRFNAANYTTTWDGTNIAWKAIHYYYNGPDDDLYHTDAAYYSGHWTVPTP